MSKKEGFKIGILVIALICIFIAIPAVVLGNGGTTFFSDNGYTVESNKWTNSFSSYWTDVENKTNTCSITFRNGL